MKTELLDIGLWIFLLWDGLDCSNQHLLLLCPLYMDIPISIPFCALVDAEQYVIVSICMFLRSCKELN